MATAARLVVISVICACAFAQYEQDDRAPRYIASQPKVAVTPVPILKQINRHNEDGSYTYGYEGGDGSFKIETKAATGEVSGKYGYKDDTGKLRVVEYGANKYGFQPAGEGITVAPPTLVDESTNDRPTKQGSRSQYREQQEQQAIDYDYEEPAPAPQSYRAPAPQPQPAYRAPAPQPQQPAYRAPAPQQAYRAPAQQQAFRAAQSAPAPPKPAFFSGAAPAPIQEPAGGLGNFFTPSAQAPPQPAFRAPKQPQQSFNQFQTQAFPKPQIEYSQDYNNSPAPQFSSPQFSQQRNQKPFSMLDQLLKEYALPSNGAAPLHDITFGSY